jgi:hypothetical protein
MKLDEIPEDLRRTYEEYSRQVNSNPFGASEDEQKIVHLIERVARLEMLLQKGNTQ